MAAVQSTFYVIGGTMQRDAQSYVRRQADNALYDALNEGKFCYVLTSRQMGKSSLMVRTATRLREDGVAVAVLDLTAIGQRNLTAEQWYYGLLNRIGDQLGLRSELKAFRQDNEHLSPLQRWMLALREVVLTHHTGRVVIFIDEIDAVRSLPFSTDEFFAGIRELYNHRTEDADLNRLTFCLLGVATPSDLIQDTRTTPFNIGQRIELTDFTVTEALPLARGFGRENGTGANLLQRVVWWTNGHPYLTQRLCRAVAEDASVTDAAGVDRLCNELFLSSSARVQDDNLQFVSNRMLKSEGDLTSLLDMYSQVRKGKKVQDDKTNPLVSILRLSGITRVHDGDLRLRNRIYKRVFDEDWVQSNIPDAEVRRQRAAYRKGLLRAASIAAVILLVIGALAFAAFYQTKRAVSALNEVEKEKRRADQLLYAAQMNLAQQALEKGNFLHLSQILDRLEDATSSIDLRGFEWFYIWNLCPKFINASTNTLCLAFSPDGQRLATSSDEGIVKIWDVSSKQELLTLKGDAGSVFSIAFSPDGKLLVTGGQDNIAKVWNVSNGQQTFSLKGHLGAIYSVAFSPDGKRLATGSQDKTVKIWDGSTGKEISTLKAHFGSVRSVRFSPNGNLLATAGFEGDVNVWDVADWKKLYTIKAHSIAVFSVIFSPDEQLLATASDDKTVKLWQTSTKREVLTLKGHSGPVYSLAFSPDGKQLATGSFDKTIKLWDVSSDKELSTLKGNTGSVYTIAISPDGKLLATGGFDEHVNLWNLSHRKDVLTLGQSSPVFAMAFSPDGKRLAIGSQDGTIQLWDLNTEESIFIIKGSVQAVFSLAYSPDGKLLASGSEDGSIKFWDASTGKEERELGDRSLVYSIAFSPNGKLLATSDLDGSAKIWDVRYGVFIRSLDGHSDMVRSVAFSPDGRRLATASDDETIKLWDVSNGQILFSFNKQSGRVHTVIFSPDGKQLVTGSDDSTVKIWDALSGQELKEIFISVKTVAFSPDGKRLAIGTDDKNIGLWDVSSGQELLTLKGHTDVINAVAFAPDGKTLASGSSDKTVKLWSAAGEE